VKRAWSNESNESNDDGVDGETDGEGSTLVSVGESDGARETSAPHSPQKRLDSGTTDAHEGQRIGQECQK
jgi:hypothetical protein